MLPLWMQQQQQLAFANYNMNRMNSAPSGMFPEPGNATVAAANNTNTSLMIQQGMLQANPFNAAAAAAYHHHQQQQQQQQQQQYAALQAHYQRAAQSAIKQPSAEPEYIALPEGIVPTFANLPSVSLTTTATAAATDRMLLPMMTSQNNNNNNGQKTIYRLSLLSLTEFTVSASMVVHNNSPYAQQQEYPIPVTGLRIHIKKIAKGHGKASYEKYREGGDDDDDGPAAAAEQVRWRIPLGCYQALFGYLASSSPHHVVIGIPENQLKAASLGAQRADKSFPSAKRLAKAGVPPGLAQAMAPYQRGGVDFILDKHGRALIADEMGLGKTVQAIAAMSVYKKDWPLLVFTPSSARYHWEAEILQWLGRNSSINTCDDYDLLGSEDELELEKEKKKVKRSRNGGDAEALVDSDGDGDGENPAAGAEDGDGSEDGDGMFDDFNDFSEPSLGRLKRASGDRSVRHTQVPSKKRKQTFGNYKRGVSKGGGSSFQIMQPLAERRNNSGLLRESEVHVMTSGKDVWNNRTRVVICSYGLAPSLAEKNKINAKKFPCVICDESHMLKNIKSKRTAALLPMLKATKRCLMLSGTPAFARPQELFPQLTVLGSNLQARDNGSHQWWQDEGEFLAKYCKSGRGASKIGGKNMSELHALLESTVMIRRLKTNILKDLPKKRREKAYIHISDHALRLQLAKRMELLRTARGVLGKIANDHWDNDGGREDYEKNNPSLQNHEQGDGECQPEDDAEVERKRNLTELFLLTGMGKVPTIVAKLKEWLADPLKGKICVFAHHRAVLDALEDQLFFDENSPLSMSKYIRIDGQTMPRSRQDKILEFQRNPRVRIAILGVTAAGVAVTLTAASTVWFAEMFWTPAVLIQAEDRVHRIGQQSNVTCLYLIAKGTLDEILWKLVEKKFHALGEFVEGKGETLAVHREGGLLPGGGHNDNTDAKKGKSSNGRGNKRTIMDSDSEDGEEKNDNEDGIGNNKQVKIIGVEADEELSETDEALSANINSIFGDSSMVDEIIQLGKDERRKSMGPKDDDADSADENEYGVYGDPTRTRASEIIELSDDDDECIEVPPPPSSVVGGNADKASIQSSCDNPIQIDDDEVVEGNTNNDRGNDQSEEHVGEDKENSKQETPQPLKITDALEKEELPRPNLRLYKLQFVRPSYGITIAEYSQKIVVKGSSPARQKQFGKECKPHAGDIVVSIQGSQLPKGMKFSDCVNLMKRTIGAYPVVEVVFAEEPTFKEAFRQLMIRTYHEALAKEKAAQTQRDEALQHDDGGGVIVIDDDE